MDRAALGRQATTLPTRGRPSRVGHSSIALTLAATAFFLLHLTMCWPGIMTWDSEDQFAQALAGKYGNWHPPVMAVLWHALHPLAAVGAPMLVVHLFLYWGSLLLIALNLSDLGRRRWAYAVLGSGLLPNLVLLSAFIHKDVGLATASLAAFAVVFAYRGRNLPLPWPAAALAMILLSYAILVRNNAVFAAGPIVAYIIAPHLTAGPLRLLILSAAIAVLAIAASGIINARLLRAANDSPQRSLFVFDTTAIASRAHDPTVFERAHNPSLTLIDGCYKPALWDGIYGTRNCKQGIDNEWIHGATWLRAIARHPLAYASHRLAHWNAALSFWSPYERWIWYDNPAFNLAPARSEAAIKEGLHRIGNFPLFSPALALCVMLTMVLSIIGFNQQVISGPTQAAYFLSTAGILYSGSFLLVGVASMYRYQQLPLSAAAVSFLLYAAGGRDRPAVENKTAYRWITIAAVSVLTIVAVARLVLPAEVIN